MAFEQLKLSSQLCFRLYSASRLVTQTYNPFLDKLGITYPQYLVMMVLWETDKSMEKEAAKVPQCMLNHFSKCGLSKEEVFQLVPLLDKLIDSLKDHTKDSFENEVEEK